MLVSVRLDGLTKIRFGVLCCAKLYLRCELRCCCFTLQSVDSVHPSAVQRHAATRTASRICASTARPGLVLTPFFCCCAAFISFCCSPDGFRIVLLADYE